MKWKILFWAISIIGLYSRELTKVVVIDFLNVTYCDPDYMIVRYEMKKLDRKTISLNFSTDVLRDITNLKVRIVVYKFVDNVYKGTAIRYSGDMCSLLEMVHQKYHLNKNKKLEHLFTRCPLKKGYYYVHNFSGKDFGTAILPPWKTKSELEFEVDGKIVGTAYILVTVVEE